MAEHTYHYTKKGIFTMSGKGKVLFMDDEQIILDMTREILKFLDYDVMFAREGREAMTPRRRKTSARPT